MRGEITDISSISDESPSNRCNAIISGVGSNESAVAVGKTHYVGCLLGS